MLYKFLKLARDDASVPSARQGLFYMGAQLYNDLPTSVRNAENRKSFVVKLDFFLNTKNLEFNYRIFYFHFHFTDIYFNFETVY